MGLKNFGQDSDNGIEEIGSSLMNLQPNQSNTGTEKDDRISRERIRGSLYVWDSDRDDVNSVRHLLKHTKDVFLPRMSRDSYERAYGEVVERMKGEEEEYVNGRSVIETFEDYL